MGENYNIPDQRKGDFHCRICDSRMNTPIMWNLHITGRRHLKNIKKPPGVEPSKVKAVTIDAKPLIDEELKKIDKKDPVVGLDYIVETRRNDPKVNPNYHCTLCQGTYTMSGIIEHIISAKHRMHYLRQVSPDEMQLIEAMNLSDRPFQLIVLEKCLDARSDIGKGNIEVKLEKMRGAVVMAGQLFKPEDLKPSYDIKSSKAERDRENFEPPPPPFEDRPLPHCSQDISYPNRGEPLPPQYHHRDDLNYDQPHPPYYQSGFRQCHYGNEPPLPDYHDGHFYIRNGPFPLVEYREPFHQDRRPTFTRSQPCNTERLPSPANWPFHRIEQNKLKSKPSSRRSSPKKRSLNRFHSSPKKSRENLIDFEKPGTSKRRGLIDSSGWSSSESESVKSLKKERKRSRENLTEKCVSSTSNDKRITSPGSSSGSEDKISEMVIKKQEKTWAATSDNSSDDIFIIGTSRTKKRLSADRCSARMKTSASSSNVDRNQAISPTRIAAIIESYEDDIRENGFKSYNRPTRMEIAKRCFNIKAASIAHKIFTSCTSADQKILRRHIVKYKSHLEGRMKKN